MAQDPEDLAVVQFWQRRRCARDPLRLRSGQALTPLV